MKLLDEVNLDMRNVGDDLFNNPLDDCKLISIPFYDICSRINDCVQCNYSPHCGNLFNIFHYKNKKYSILKF